MSVSTSPALLAKLASPKTIDAVMRPRLFGLLDAAAESKITWLTGEPGAGKTTLVASYLKARKRRTLWYHVDEGDLDAATFFHYMSLGARPLLRKRTEPLRHLSAEYQKDLAGFTRRFLRELFSKVAAPIVLVLDDFQVLQGDLPLGQALIGAFSETPPHNRIVVISRETHPASLARMVANRDLVEVDAHELRLTLEESRQLLASLGTREDDIAQQLHAQVDGWAAGLVLLSTPAARNATTNYAGAGRSHTTVFNYFATEVFGRMSQETRELLMATALFANFSESMARSLSGNANTSEILGQLLRDHLFMTAFQGDPRTYRYHPIFRDFLLDRLSENRTLQELSRLRCHAATLLEQMGQMEEAVALYCRAGDFEASVRIIVRQAPDLISQGRGLTVQGWLRLLPADFVNRSPELLYWLALAQRPREPRLAREILERAHALLMRSGRRANILEIAAAIAECHVLEWSDMHGLDAWLPVFARAAHRYPKFETLESELRVLPGMLAAFVYRQCQHPAAAKLLARAEELIDQHPQLDNQMLLGAVAYIHNWRGTFDALDKVLRHMRLLAANPGAAPLMCIWWDCALVYISTVQGDFDAACAALSRAEQLARSEDLNVMDATIALRGGMAFLSVGQLDAAADYCRRASKLVSPHRHVEHCTYLRLQGWLHLLRGEASQAISLLRLGHEAAERCGMEVVRISAATLLAMALTENRQFEEAHDLLRWTLDQPLVGASFLLQKRHALARARLAQLAGEREQLEENLRKGFGLGRRLNSLSESYSYHPIALASLCAEALALGIESEFVAAVIRKFHLRPPVASCRNWPWRLRLYCMGRFEIVVDDKPQRTPGKVARKPIELLQLLVAHGRHGVHSSTLAAVMWPDAEGDAAQNAFSQTLHRLRRLLGTDRAVTSIDGRVALNADTCWVDAWAFDDIASRCELLKDAESPPRLELTALADALRDTYRGDFLAREPELGHLLRETERLRLRLGRAVTRLGRALERAGAKAEAGGLEKWALEHEGLQMAAQGSIRKGSVTPAA